VEKKPAEKEEGKEGKTVTVSAGGAQETPKAIIWSVLILLCSLLVFAAINEWKKLNIEETSRKT